MITDIKVLDNFYDQPDLVLNLVTDFVVPGCGTGLRSVDIQQVNPQLGFQIKNVLCQMHGVDPAAIKMGIFFMGHDYSDEDELFNSSTVHIDGKSVDGNGEFCRVRDDYYKLAFCGQISLTKNADPEAAVTIHKFKPHIKWDEQEIVRRCIDEYTNPGEWYRAGKIDLEEFKRMRKEYDENFDLTCEIKNVYNRMVSWKAGTLHAQRWTKSVPHVLNQYFFAEWI
jgi:hypothetical protein